MKRDLLDCDHMTFAASVHQWGRRAEVGLRGLRIITKLKVFLINE